MMMLQPTRDRLRRAYLALLWLACLCRYDLTGNLSGVCPECGRVRREHDDDIREPWRRQAARVALAYAVLAVVTAPLALRTFFCAFTLPSLSLLNIAIAIGIGHLLLAPLLLPMAAYPSKRIARRMAYARAQPASNPTA